jgi:hypothetical protein
MEIRGLPPLDLVNRAREKIVLWYVNFYFLPLFLALHVRVDMDNRPKLVANSKGKFL